MIDVKVMEQVYAAMTARMAIIDQMAVKQEEQPQEQPVKATSEDTNGANNGNY